MGDGGLLRACLMAVLLYVAIAQQDEYDAKLVEMIGTSGGQDGDKQRRDYQNELGITFNCDVNSINNKRRATNIHELRPTDVDVVSAIGDSITAGYGIACGSVAGVVINNRGESWSVGGDEDLDTVITLTNALRKYNPDVKGYSVLTGGTGNARSWMNRASGGAIASGMANQARDLVTKLKTDDRIDYENDWKVMTLHISGNDFCSYCYDRDRYSPDNYERHIRAALDVFHAEVPRMLVQLVPLFDVTNLGDMSTGLICDGLQRGMCGCAFGNTKPEMRPLQLEYSQRMKNIALSGDYDTRDDFTVVTQPSMTDISDVPLDPDTGEVDKSWLSHDCFHPDRKAHQLMALNLWNTMFTPVPEKPDYPGEDAVNLVFSCPSEENPYITTNLNSRRDVPVPVLYSEEDPEEETGEASPLTILAVVLGAFGVVGVSILGATATRRMVRKKKAKRAVEMRDMGTDNPACQEA